jgi:hypothetical protein
MTIQNRLGCHFGGPEFASAIMNFENFMFGLVYIKWFLRDEDQKWI